MAYNLTTCLMPHGGISTGMRKVNVVSSLALVLASGVIACLPANAQKAASATTLKVGYFNLNLVKASSPDAAGSESLKNQAESQLRREVEEANKNLQKALSDKKPQEEVQKMAKEVQTEINAKQKALAELVQAATAQANQKIYQAVNQVAAEKSLDLVVDGAGVYAGGQKVIDNGQDITADVIKKLSPAAALLSKEAQPQPAKAAAAAAPAQPAAK